MGELEATVLLAILQQGATAFGLEVRREIELATLRPVSRGVFYTTLDRRERKEYATGQEAAPPPGLAADRCGPARRPARVAPLDVVRSE
jgi:DNA-binding PadR family transcriptional regulator